jgi:protein-S-isoprenylcysteine O-methyltransferase Ste14
MKINTSPSVVIRIILWLVLLIGGAALGIMLDWNDPLFRNLYFHLLSASLGLLVLHFSFRAAANGGRELSRGRVGDIPRLETNRLVMSGIYSCMRHPMLFGLTLFPLGWALLTGSPTFILIIAPLEMLFIILMVVIFEEMEAEKKFGDAYRHYRKEVPMVSFRVVCLKKLFARNTS